MNWKELIRSIQCTMSPWGFSEMTIQRVRHKYHACCLLRARFLAFQPVVDNTRGIRVEQVVSSFQKILRGSQLTWYIWNAVFWLRMRTMSYQIYSSIYSTPYLIKSFKVLWSLTRIMEVEYRSFKVLTYVFDGVVRFSRLAVTSHSPPPGPQTAGLLRHSFLQ